MLLLLFSFFPSIGGEETEEEVVIEVGGTSVLDILSKGEDVSTVLSWPELSTFDKCFTLFNSTFVASKNGVVDGFAFTDSVLTFNKPSLSQDGFNFQPKRIKLWPDAKVPLLLDPLLTKAELKLLGCSLRWFHENSCIRFHDVADNERATGYLYITKSDSRGGCFTEEMGYQARKVQILNLQTGSSCWEMGTITHELFHVLGFAHEQQREDRDKYISIHYDNIPTLDEPLVEVVGETTLGPGVCELSEWGKWSKCSVSCGLGARQRSRLPITSEVGVCGNATLQETKPCRKRKCPLCKLTTWEPWSECSTSCAEEKGMSFRTRKIKFRSNKAVKCDGKLFDIRECHAKTSCPIDCTIGEWAEWGKCDAVQCLSIRTRFVHVEPKNGGAPCPAKFQSRACTSHCHRQGHLVNMGCIEEDGHRCWLLSLKPLNYTAAWDECRSQGGTRLAHLDNPKHYYTFKAQHEKFRRAFWLWSANPACGPLGGHWVGAKVTSSEDWFWVENAADRDGLSFKRNWPSFDQRFSRITNGAGPAVHLSVADLRFSNGGFDAVKCGFICEFLRNP